MAKSMTVGKRENEKPEIRSNIIIGFSITNKLPVLNPDKTLIFRFLRNGSARQYDEHQY